MKQFVLKVSICLVSSLSLANLQRADVETKPIDEVAAIALSDDFSVLAVIETDGSVFRRPQSIKLVNRSTNQLVRTITWDQDWGDPQSAVFCPERKYLAVIAGNIGDAKIARVFDLATGELTIDVRQSIFSTSKNGCFHAFAVSRS